MKKALLLLFSTTAFFCRAQTNGGFETWNSTLGFEEPDNWVSSNIATLLGFADSLSCLKTTNACNSQFAVRLRSVEVTFIGKDTVAGFLQQQIAYNKRPLTLRYCYSQFNKVTDTAMISVEFYKGSTDSQANLIGFCDAQLNPTKTWATGTNSITWLTADQPDTMIIIISSGSDGKINELLIDNVSLSDFGAGITDVKALDAKVFSTPGKIIQVSLNQPAEKTQFRLFDLNGKLVYESSLDTQQTSVNVSTLNSGLYVYQLFDANGIISIKSGKLFVE